MKDTRVEMFRKSLQGLVDSLDATVRVARWTGEEAIPDPLRDSASKLIERLGTADRLAGGTFRGSPADVARVEVMLKAMRRLDAAYVAYRKRLEGSSGSLEGAAAALVAELDDVKGSVL